MRGRGERLTHALRRARLILPIWIGSLVWMWSWWLDGAHPKFEPLFSILTFALLYEFAILPSTFLYFIFKAKNPRRRIAPKGQKVAVISPCVPSMESLDIVERQLKAMSEITYPHDSWILDEGNSKEIKKLARKYGVKHFTRRGKPKYNRPNPPFKAKTKAGNVNAWLDHVKRRKYDFFVQLDIDHIPKPNYLNKTLGHFRDPEVAWVQAPSVYANLDTWTSRGAAEQELVLQGPLQMGFYGHSETPFIIGSHSTYRMSAIREIGGFQPTRAEDHLDTLYMSSLGYKGVFLSEVIAEGDGPETLTTYLAQQYAWAYSMLQVLMYHTPKMFKTMPLRRQWQFLFAQTWYPLWSLSYLIMFMAPAVALWAGENVLTVAPKDMLTHFLPLYISGFLVWLSARPLMNPQKLRLSWRGIVLHAVRWPVIFKANIDAMLRVKKPYMITPKGAFARMAPTMQTYRPFLLLGMISALSVMLVSIFNRAAMPESQAVFVTLNALFMLTICSVDIGYRFKAAKPSWLELKKFWMKPVFATAALGCSLIVALSTLTTNLVYQDAVLASISQQHVTSSRVVPVHYGMSTEALIRQISYIEPYTTDEPVLGLYNQPEETIENQSDYIQLSFVDWRDEHYLALALAETLQAGNTPVITIEPRGEDNGQKLLQEIAEGKHDTELENINKIISTSKNKVYIRFAHEMELAKLYPWGNQEPELYINAYRRAFDKIKANQAPVSAVWSPAGNNGAEAYYPGDEYVDVVGTTVLYDQYWYGDRLPEFSEIAGKRQWLKNLNKPLWIVEFGAGHADSHNQDLMVEDALANYKHMGFDKMIYLNMVDANIDGPDYRLHETSDFGNLAKSKKSH